MVKLNASIIKASEILKILASGKDRLEGIQKDVGLNKTTTHRLLKSLTASKLVYQNPADRTYHLGPLLLKLTVHPHVTHKLLVMCAVDELTRLRDLTGESAMIIIPNGNLRLVVKEVPSNRELSLSMGDGHTTDIYVGSAGRVLLSQFSDDVLEKHLRSMAFAFVSPNTITDKQELLKEIERIRKNGYAISLGERFPGAGGLSVPVKGYICPVALSIFGPQFRFEVTEQILREIFVSSGRITKKLATVMPEK